MACKINTHMMTVVFTHLGLISILWASLVKQDHLLVYLSIIPSTKGSKSFTLAMILGCLTVAVLHAMVIFAVYYRKRYFLIPWMLQIVLEIAGSLAFGAICAYDYFTCEQPCCVGDLGCLSITFLTNAIVALAYAIYLVYIDVIACMYYRHCIKTGDIDMFLEQAAKMATPLVTSAT